MLKGMMSPPATEVYDSLEAAANPIKTVPPMSMFMLGVAALIMHARRAKADPTMKNHRLSKRSDSHAARTCREGVNRATKTMLGSGPMSALIPPRSGVARANPLTPFAQSGMWVK